MVKRLAAALGVLVFVAVTALTAHAQGNKCQGAKIKDAGKKAACLTGLQAKIATAGTGTLDPAAVAKCASKVGAAFAKLEGKGGCNTTGDSTTIEDKVDAFVDDVANELTCAPPPTGTSTCAPIVVGAPIPGTYTVHGTTGEMRCTTNAAANRFGTCTSDAQCGNTAGACKTLPWVTADGQVMPFATGTSTTFTVNAEAAFPGCGHNLCIPCGNPNAACKGIPACEISGNPFGCVPRGTQGCCDQPGFIVPVFFVDILGGLCSRVDQYDCGIGVINTSNPQTGDNEVVKKGDTSDPGPDCIYGNGDDVPKPCTSSMTGAGGDYAGKIVTTYGNGSADTNGIQYRLQTPELSTTWQDSQSPSGTCAPGSVFDSGDLGLTSQILLKTEPTTAGATGQFMDLNGDSCSRVGSGFTSALPDGPITVPGGASGPAKPQPYNGSAGSVAAAVSEVFSGFGSPIHDIGFVAITPNTPIVPACHPVACSCTPQPHCPE